MSFEAPKLENKTENPKKENQDVHETEISPGVEESKNHFDVIKEAIEFKIGKELPKDKEELFRNFENLIPKEIDHINIADKLKPDDKYASMFRYSREGIKSALEKELYGSTIKDVEEYFRNKLENSEKEIVKEQRSAELGYKKNFDNKLDRRHDKDVDLFNQISSNSFGNPLAEIELRINDIGTNESEKEKFRNFAKRLSVELYQGKPKEEVTLDDIKKQIQKEAGYFSNVEDEDTRKDNASHFVEISKKIEQGDLSPALEEIEYNIGWLQERLEGRKDKNMKGVAERTLKEKYGENFMPAINKELEKLRNYREFLTERVDTKNSKKIDINQVSYEKTAEEDRRKIDEIKKKLFTEHISEIVPSRITESEFNKVSVDLGREISELEKGKRLSPESDKLIEKIGEDELLGILKNITHEIKQKDLFHGYRSEELDVYGEQLKDSKLPFHFYYEGKNGYDFFHRKELDGAGHLDRGVVVFNGKLPDAKQRLKNWADGWDNDYQLMHEAIHGYQVPNREWLKKYSEIIISNTTKAQEKLKIDPSGKDKNFWEELSFDIRAEIMKMQKDCEEKIGEKFIGNEFEQFLMGRPKNDSEESFKARRALQEVHAFWKRSSVDSLKNRETYILDHLKEGSHYGYDESAIKNGIKYIKQLKALGVGDKEIGNLIFSSKIDLSSQNIYEGLADFVNKTKNKDNISDREIEMLAKIDDLRDERDLLYLQNLALKEIKTHSAKNKLTNRFRKIFTGV